MSEAAPVVTRRNALSRSVSPTALTSAGLLVVGIGLAWVYFGRGAPPPDYDALDANAQAVTVRRVTRQPPEPVAEAPVQQVVAPTQHQFVMPEVAPEPVAATATATVNNGPLFVRHDNPTPAQRVGRTEVTQTPGAQPVAVAARGGVTFKQPQVEGGEALVVTDLGRTLKPTTRIGCTLSQSIDGTHAGPLVCSITRPVVSWDGSTVLLPAGTPIIGTYQPLAVGQGRMMAMAAQAITSDGMIVPLGGSGGSPMTDELGRIGMPGYVDSRLWERIGNAIIADIAFTAIKLPSDALRSQGRSVQFNASGTEDIVSQVLRPTADLSPLFRKNQGEEISILLTAPVHFGAVRYEVVR